MSNKLQLEKLKGDIWNLKPILTEDEINDIVKNHKRGTETKDVYELLYIDVEDVPCVCRDIERNIIEKLQAKLQETT